MYSWATRMLTMQRVKVTKWLSAVIPVAVALAAFAAFGVISYKIISAVGVVGIVVIIAGFALNAAMIKAEDMSDEIEKPDLSRNDDKNKNGDK